jgi:hypothetical protein
VGAAVAAGAASASPSSAEDSLIRCRNQVFDFAGPLPRPEDHQRHDDHNDGETDQHTNVVTGHDRRGKISPATTPRMACLAYCLPQPVHLVAGVAIELGIFPARRTALAKWVAARPIRRVEDTQPSRWFYRRPLRPAFHERPIL